MVVVDMVAAHGRTGGGSPDAAGGNIVGAVVPHEHQGLSAFHGDGVADFEERVLPPLELDGAHSAWCVCVRWCCEY